MTERAVPACTGMTELFYTVTRTKEALAVCASCPVRRRCLEHAIATEPSPRLGVRGGKTAGERSALAGERTYECLHCGMPTLGGRRPFCGRDCWRAAIGLGA